MSSSSRDHEHSITGGREDAPSREQRLILALTGIVRILSNGDQNEYGRILDARDVAIIALGTLNLPDGKDATSE